MTEEYELAEIVYDFDETITFGKRARFDKHIYKKIQAFILMITGQRIPLKVLSEIGLKSYREEGHSVHGIARTFGLDPVKLYKGYHLLKEPGVNDCDREHTRNLQALVAFIKATKGQIGHSILTHSTMPWVKASLTHLTKKKAVKGLERAFKDSQLFTAEKYMVHDEDGNKLIPLKGTSYYPLLFTCVSLGIRPEEAAFFEDSTNNLRVAAQLGTPGYYINNRSPHENLPSFVRGEFRSVAGVALIPHLHTPNDPNYDKGRVTEALAMTEEVMSKPESLRVLPREYPRPLPLKLAA